MNISALETTTIYTDYNAGQPKEGKSVAFSDKMSSVNEKSEMELNLDYYHSLCKEFPGCFVLTYLSTHRIRYAILPFIEISLKLFASTIIL